MIARHKKAEPAASDTGRLASRLLAELFAGYEEGDRITVLDLGAGNADTIRFLSQFRARMYFADLLENPELAQPPEDHTPEQLAALITQQLAIPAGTSIDVCLLWDYLHYFDTASLEVLSSVLQPLLAKGARGYGFGTLQGKPPQDSNEYGIADLTSLSAHASHLPNQYYAHSQQRLSEHFPALQIVRGTLLREGHLELLFEAV